MNTLQQLWFLVIILISTIILYTNLPTKCKTTEMYEYTLQKTKINMNLTLDVYKSRSDSRRQYKIFDFINTGKRKRHLVQKYNVTLASQSSLDRLVTLIEISEKWSGPISVAVFGLRNEISLLLIFIEHLKKCYLSIKNNVDFHLMILAKDLAFLENIKQRILTELDECNNSKKFHENLLKYISKDVKKLHQIIPYPQNHLRNIARKNCQTLYVFLVDIDIIPSNQMAKLLNKFLKNRPIEQKIAYVIPTFELDLSRKFPENKANLLSLIQNGFSRPFHEKVFIYNQFATNFSYWLKNNNSQTTRDIFISHFVTDFEMFYEPFYVAIDSVPVHNERFYGYGYTRNSQVYEMFLAGYKFAVLGPIFTIHWSLQKRENRPVWREKQNTRNRILFNVIKQELLIRYGKREKT